MIFLIVEYIVDMNPIC